MAWSDSRLQELAASFVPCADEVHRLQTGSDAECRLFQRFCEQGHYRRPNSTRQGLYAVTPNGVLLASCNERRPDRVARVLEQALAKWRTLATDQRHLDDATRDALGKLWRWDDEYPEDGLVLDVTARDLPRDEPAAAERRGRGRSRWTQRAWNRDFAWFRAAEVTRWIPLEPEVGVRHAVPARFVRRLARFCLLDNVRGQTMAFARGDVTRAELEAEVVSVDADRIVLRLNGATHAEGEGDHGERGFETRLQGSAQWDRAAARFTAFELVATGQRWGGTRFNKRDRDPGPAPIGVVLRLADRDAPRVAPAFIWSYGWRPTRR